MSQLLDGRYQFIKILGSDSLGQTYLVSNTQLPGQPQCVIKHLRLPDQNSRTLKFVLTLLKKKAESLKKVGKHDRIPDLLDYFEDGENFYLVEEFVPGHSLSEEFVKGQLFSEARVVKLIQEVLNILVIVHGWGVVHRCIKPSNLIRRQADGNLVLTGFGIFRDISSQATRSHDPSSENSLNGASAYVSPEQHLGQLQFNVDIYAVGTIAIQALTGLSASSLARLLYVNDSGTREHSWHEQVQVSPELAGILDKMVQPDGTQRYQQATDVLDDLRQIIGNSTGLAPLPATSLPEQSNGAQPTFRASPFRLPALQTKRWALPAIATVAVAGGLVALLYNKLPQSWMAQYFLQQGSERVQKEDDKQAIASYTQAIQTHPSGSAYYSRGLAHSRLGEQQAALEDLTQALTLDANLAQAYYQRGNIRFQLGDRQGAIADYTQAVRRDPSTPAAYVNRGSVRADLGDEQGAVEDYTRAIQLDPNLVAAYLNRCLSRSNLEDHQGAIADCTQAINLQPNSVLAYQNRGLVRRRIGELTGAIEDFNIAIRLDPKDADPYYNRGLARLDLGDKQGAIADYTQAIRNDPNHVFAYYDRGLLRVELGDLEGAIADFQQSATLCLDSGRTGCYEDAQFQLKKLQSTPSSPVSEQ